MRSLITSSSRNALSRVVPISAGTTHLIICRMVLNDILIQRLVIIGNVLGRLTLTLQKCAEEKRARVRSASGGWPRTVRLRRIEAYLTAREVLPETSKGADGVPGASLAVLAGNRFATLGYILVCRGLLTQTWHSEA